MTHKERRELKANLHNELTEILCKEEYDDSKYFLALLYAQSFIAQCLERFSDVVEGIDNE